MSALAAILTGVHACAREVYRQTGREIRAIGVAVDDYTFEAAAMMWVEELSAKDATFGKVERLAEILEYGVFEGEANGTPVRIVRERLIVPE